MRIIGKHHIRATFYHIVALVFLLTTTLWFFGIVNDRWSLIITIVLFVADYIAEMYDPHPDNPGPWFKAHFHRFYDGEDNDECELSRANKKLDAETKKFFEESNKKIEKRNRSKNP